MSHFDDLKQQLTDAAAAFTEDDNALGQVLRQMADHVERVLQEPLEIFPVAHHSPSSAFHLVRRLQQQQPKVIYIELCEDLLDIVGNLKDCKLPVALQAYTAESDIIPVDQLPVAVVAPLTESSAEYQAIAYTLTHPETQLVFVDRAVDYVFQWKEDEGTAPDESEDEIPPEEEATMHGTAVGVSVGSLMPTFDTFLHYLLRNSNTRHFAEWWDQYVERAILGSDYATYRQVMVLIGSLLRQVGRRPKDVEVDRLRERYMWTRMKQHMAEHNIQPEEAIHICGAAHTGSDVAEFGTHNATVWEDIPEKSATEWLLGLIPSSFAAIEYQFSHPAGTVFLAESTWKKGLKAAQIRPFTLQKNASGAQKVKPLPEENRLAAADTLFNYLTQPPAFADADQNQLVEWCARIVALARKNGYLASTADSIAIYETAMLLAGMRNRRHPTPYDFQDSAITCLEKDRTPKKRNIAQLCRIMLGGDRVGTVGYESLPPLAQNIYDRLEPLNVNLFAKTNQRALMDFNKRPELLDCSELLWRLNYLLGNTVVQPIMGERVLGQTPIQESWEIRIGKYQRPVIQLGYEGVTLEQVLEQRMKQRAFDDKATAAVALYTAEASLLYLNSPRLTGELGRHSTHLLEQEQNVKDAPDIFDRARRLVHYYRTTPEGLPQWIEDFVATGYTHYASLLPQAMIDQGTTPAEIGGMLGFIFSLESLALSLGCQRSQLVISVQQAGQVSVPPDKRGLLWTAEWLLNMQTIDSIREQMQAIIADETRLPALPAYLNGFILALTFAPRIALFIVELLSDVFRALPDSLLLPWLPKLILQLRDHQHILQPLFKEVSGVFPASLAGFANWQPDWLSDAVPEAMPHDQQVALTDDEALARHMLFRHPAAANAIARLLDVDEMTWQDSDTQPA